MFEYIIIIIMGLLLILKYRNHVFRRYRRLNHNISDNEKENKNSKDFIQNNIEISEIILADTLEKCESAVELIKCNLNDNILGFDCEWVKRGPVSLIQLATSNGVCALFRVGKFGYVPPELKDLLTDRRLLKVGVASFEDGKKVLKDFGCQVLGTVDLRTLASLLSLPCPTTLANICTYYLNIEMNKGIEVRCGDWDADILTTEQKNYAAYDAFVSVLIYHQILKEANQKLSLLEKIILYAKKTWNKDVDEKYHMLPQGVIDKRFSLPNGSSLKSNNCNNKINKQNSKPLNVNTKSAYKRILPTRNKPLYHNCYMEAPDGELLCTCDRKKAEWYVTKELGKVVKDDPFTIRLNFEPSGRALGEVGQYYVQVKENQCVVCGQYETFVRKNVIPHEYRKHFPVVMKSHQSHDVVLLCPRCHEMSNIRDLELRIKLSEMCDAPLYNNNQMKNNELRKYIGSVKALKNSLIPMERRKRLENYIANFEKENDITDALAQNQIHIKKVLKEAFNELKPDPHGLKVVNYFLQKELGLVELERLWRQYFLDTMQPLHMPKLWSVKHNEERLVIRQMQNRIEPEDARVAGLTVPT